MIFDTDLTGRRYDHGGTYARCQHCGQEFRLLDSDTLESHARAHEAQLAVTETTIEEHSPQPIYPHPRR